MAAPFSGEDLIKRSILSSILGLKIKSPRFNHQLETTPCPPKSTHPRVPNYDRPCSSKAILQEDHQESVKEYQRGGVHFFPDSQHQIQYTSPYEELTGGDQTLSEKLAESLFLASPQAQFSTQTAYPGPSPQDIYQEIVCECQHFEQQADPKTDLGNSFICATLPHKNLNVLSPTYLQEPQQGHKMYNNDSVSPLYTFENEMQTRQTFQNICMNCHHAIAPKMPHTQEAVVHQERLVVPQEDKKAVMPHLAVFEHLKQAGVGPVSLEEFIKMVVVAVKEVGGMSRGIHDREETPEEILHRKRQQNNEAAARYRRRQKEARLAGENEIAALLDRNKELKFEIQEVQNQIDIIKSKFGVNLPLKHP